MRKFKETTIAVPVRQVHLDKGKPCKSEGCPVALALMDLLNPHGVSVGTATASVYYKRRFLRTIKGVYYNLDFDARQLIREFDADESQVIPQIVHLTTRG